MTWLSINPDSEPFIRLSAVVALNTNPEGEDTAVGVVRDLIDPVRLADCYNKVEELGIDLNTVGVVMPDTGSWDDD